VVKYENNCATKKSSNPGLYSVEVANRLFDIEPNEECRPLRDEEWIKATWKDIKR
jgi:hypothetical protein